MSGYPEHSSYVCEKTYRSSLRRWRPFSVRLFVTVILLFLVLFTAVIGSLPFQSSTVLAAASGNPNPALARPDWLTPPAAQPSIDLAHYGTARTDVQASTTDDPPTSPMMPPLSISLTSQAQRVTSNDGQLEVNIPAGTVSADQISAAGGTITMLVTQTLPGSGGGRSEHIFFGTYQVALEDASGAPLTNLVLAQPISFGYHLFDQQAPLLVDGQTMYALWTDGGTSTASPSSIQANAKKARASASNGATQFIPTTLDSSTHVWRVPTYLSASSSSASSATSPANTPSSTATAAQALGTITFETTAPQATWGTPQDFQVALNAGGLNYSYPLSVPPGPGGLAPSLALSYSSGSVNESHNVQSTAPWVGEGWNLGLGSITWSQENVILGNGTNIQNVWHINDPSGISGQLIPPTRSTTTAHPLNPWPLDSNNPYLWHTAPESHAKVQEYNFGNYPCWRVWLPNGIMEEFGCTNPSRQSYQVNGQWVAYRWDLDMMTDRFGNQVHINYQQDFTSDHTAVRDAAITSIEYDDPSCHNSETMCSGNSWHPQVVISFESSNKPHHFMNTDSHCMGWNEQTNGTRCDSPIDVSGGLPAPKVSNAYVLNRMQVKVKGNVLHQYDFTYEQKASEQKTDPVSGLQESVAGYLDLTRIQESGTNGTPLNAPVVNISYTTQTQHYVDNYQHAQNACGPSWNVDCFLWSQSDNARYIQTLDNGRGWNETVTWQEAHNNSVGVSSGAVNDPFACNAHLSDGVCRKADDWAWSRQVVVQRTARSNGVTSTWNYQYYLRDNQPAHRCANGCSQGFVWGNQNDTDYADYYNAQFQGFYRVKVTQPDGSYQIHRYESTDGWGLALDSIHCGHPEGCHADPYWSPGNVLAGKDQEELDYDSQNRLLAAHTWSYGTNCPPPGVSPTGAAGGGDPAYNPGTTQLMSQMDQNNPVVVCDPRVNQEDLYQVDGVTDANDFTNNAAVVHQQINYTYDGDNRGGDRQAGYDYGNTSSVDTTGNDVNGWHFVNAVATYPYDHIHATSGIYLVSLPAAQQQRDGAGHPLTCHENVYGGNTGVSSSIYPDITKSLDHPSTSGCNGAVLVTQHNYDPQGNTIDSTDPDNHLGCNSNGSLHTACARYDTDSYATHLVTALNAKNQTVNNTYANNASGGWGQWLTSTTDANGQVTSYHYDALGRLTAVVRPGDSAASPTVTYTYTNTCSSGATNPCLELDTSTRFTVGGPTSTMRQWYDGWGRLIETRTPGPNSGQDMLTYSIYDSMGRVVLKSLPYSVPSGTGYVAPDLNKARSQTSYDGLGRALGSVIYDTGTHIVLSSTVSYTVAQGIPSFNVDTNTPFERTTTLDAYHHQSVKYTDAVGRGRYEQVFSGTGSSYSVIRTVQYNQDQVGNIVSVVTYDATAANRARYEASYDGLKRPTGFNDWDQGTCNTSPLPPSCSNSGDTAWKFTYDANGNTISQTDPRNVTTYTNYDELNRPLCRGTASWQVNPCQSSAYAAFFYDSYDNASNSTLTLPAGCQAPDGGSYPVGRTVAELFSGSAGSGWRCSGFDQRGQQSKSTLSVTADGQTTIQSVSMTYNDGGEVTALTYPDNETLTSQYDVNGRFQAAYFGAATGSDPVAFLVGKTSYTDSGQLSGLSIGGTGNRGSVPTAIFSTVIGYDGIERPQSTDATRPGESAAFWHQNRVYDNVGNVLSQNTTLPTTSGGSQSDNQVFCYDALNRLAWAGNTGTPSGGDHCALAPSGTTISGYQHPFSYDAIDRLTQGSAGTVSYSSVHPHAAVGLSSVPNLYASYDAMGNMTCRNTDTSGGQSCADGTVTGATMSYDNEGRLSTWTAPNGQNATDQFLYDNEGNRVLQRVSAVPSSGGSAVVTDTITFDEYTETTITGTSRTVIQYYNVNGQHVALRTGSILSYLLPDLLGSSSVALNYDGSVKAVQLFAPSGSRRYSEGVMPTTYNFTGQRLDTQTGLLYYNARYYDPVSGRFTRADTVQNNTTGMDPYAYVHGNPETMTDPTGMMMTNADDGGGDPGPAPAPTTSSNDNSSAGGGWDNFWGGVKQVGATVLDATTGIPSMIQDVQTVFDGSKSWQQRLLAAGDFFLNAAMDASMLIGVGEMARGMYLAGRLGGELIEHAGMKMLEHAAADTAEHVAADTAEHTAADTVEHAAAGCGGGLSFVAATRVATAAGEQTIATLHPGDEVWAYNEQSKKMELEPVVHVWINHDDDLVDVTITAPTSISANQAKAPSDEEHTKQPQSEVIHTNKKHPFLTVEKGFLPVGQITVGMHVVRADGQVGVITGWRLVPGVMTMYNLEVAQDHTFVVGDGQWVVHNCGGTGKPDPTSLVSGQKNLYTGQQYDPDVLRSRGYKLSPDDIKLGFQKSELFRDFLRSQGQTESQIKNWEYVIETWRKRGAPEIENHYWRNIYDFAYTYFHHH